MSQPTSIFQFLIFFAGIMSILVGVNFHRCGTMKPRHGLRRWIGILLALGVTSSATALSAQQFSTRVFGGYGPTNGYGPGVGASAGVQFPFPFLVRRPVFLGVWGVYHAGNEFLDKDTRLDVEQNTVLYGLEAAGVWLDEPIYIRGSGVLGAARISRKVAGGPSVNETSFLLSGGITFGKRLGHFFVGVEPSFPLVIGSDLTGRGFVLYLTAGYVSGS